MPVALLKHPLLALLLLPTSAIATSAILATSGQSSVAVALHAGFKDGTGETWRQGLLVACAMGLGAFLTWAALRRYVRQASEHETRISRLNSFYAALSQTNQLLVKESDQATLLSEICEIAVETGHANFACVHVRDADVVTRIAAAGSPMSFYDSFPLTWDFNAEDTQNTLVSRVLRNGEVAVRQDYGAAVQANPWGTLMVAHGIRSAASFPLRRAGRLFGTLSLYSNERSFFDDALLELVNEIAGDVAFALDNVDRRAELEQASAARAYQRSAELANDAKTEFLSRMSHELRTPLNAMLGFTQVIQRDAQERLSPTDQANLDLVRHAGWHLLSLVNDVLDVSRIEAGRFDIQMRSLPVAPLLDDAVQLTRQFAAQSDITLNVRYGDVEPVHVLADPVRLRQVLINLLSNAVKYNRHGGAVDLQIRSRPDHVVIEIVDAGLGMTPDQLAHLFEPFNRLGRERGRIEGTGLGLALARQLVGLMGGKLEFESHVSVGTTARVTLARTEAPMATPGQAPSAPSANEDASVGGLVLYIEDNEVNVMLVDQMLQGWENVRFMHATDGQTGLAMAESLNPDLVLLDMNLPDMSGMEVLRRLRHQPSTQHLRVVVLSANAMPSDVERARAEGAADYWTKPLNFGRFLTDVGALLSSRMVRQRPE